MLSFDSLTLDYEPYPIGLARSVLRDDDYAEMVGAFPAPNQMEMREDLGTQYLLAENTKGAVYQKVVRTVPVWERFQHYVKSEGFLEQLLAALRGQGVDLELSTKPVTRLQRAKLAARTLLARRPPKRVSALSGRFVFTAMPITGGNIRPHTDHPTKVITLVIPMIGEEGWDPAWGGGTSVVWPQDRSRIYNERNTMCDFAGFETLRTYDFAPNQALIFIKTFNSWHAVWPMTGNDPAVLRKTIVINVEAY